MRTTGWLKICSKKLFNADTRCLVYGDVTKQLKSELDYAKMIVNKQEDLTWLR